MSRRVLHWDIESRSAVDLRKAGVHVYSESSTTDIWLAALAADDEPIEVWYPGQPCPPLFEKAVAEGWLIASWNCAFERIMLKNVIAPRYGWPEPGLENWRCPMASALAMGFPAALERAAPAFGLDIAKDTQGAGLMMRMARPRKINDDGTFQWWDEIDKIKRLESYCVQDVVVERAIWKCLCPLTADEQELWALDSVINDRGLYIDEQLCVAAKKIVVAAAERLNNNMIEVTGGLVQTCSNVGQLSKFLADNGIEIDSLRKDRVANLLARRDLPDAVRDTLELRQDAAKASVKKVDAALAGRSADGRAKGLFFFNGATTGRWAGRRFQPQNLQRGTEGTDSVNAIIDSISTGDYDIVEMFHGAPLAAIGNAIRGIIKAAPGNTLIAADLANIEGRVLAWLAGEQWKLDAFAAYDSGQGPDLYKVAYGRSFGVDPAAVGSDQRQIGKVQELALGYQGGVGAFQSMARLYGVDLGRSYGMLCETASTAVRQQAIDGYEKRGKGSGIGRETWIAAEIVKLGWRLAHPGTVRLWADLESAAFEALAHPNAKVSCGKINLLKRGSFLWLQLPSGRPLCYPYPGLSEKVMPWLDRAGKPATKTTFTYKTEINRQWVDSYAYGGLWAENVTQATARDLLAEALKRLNAEGYPIVSHAHDEAVAEVPLGFGSVEGFCRTMSEQPSWAAGCPIAAAGWSGVRYRKA